MQFAVRIDRSPAEVWAYVADWRHEQDWQPGWLEVRVEPPGVIRAGSRKTKVRKTPLGTQSLTVEATRVDELAREWDDVVVDGLARGTVGRYRIVADGGGTAVHLDVQTRAYGLARLIAPLIARSSGPVLRAGFERLKLILETSETIRGAESERTTSRPS